jgi:glutamyl/glutaminyl-tRNA synthetase
MYNCRFNPSVNGPLHLGHIYTALVNESVAHESGGKFIVRFDDSHEVRRVVLGVERTERICVWQEADLRWLGFKVDKWIKQSDIIEEVHDWLSKRTGVLLDKNPPECVPELIGDDVLLYPLTPTLTAEKVVMDYMEGINLLIRGLDLLSEYSLYQYYCERFELPRVRHVYLPRLRWAHGDMSKSGGAQSVTDLRYNGYTPQQVRGMVESACLRNIANGWTLQNLKGEPRL